MDKNEIEIRISDILAMLLKAFKPILCITIAFSLLFGVFGMYRALNAEKRATVTQDDVDAAVGEVELAQNACKRAEKNLTRRVNIEIPDAETQIKRAELLVERRRSYIENSIYYHLDPFNCGVSRRTFYIDAEQPEETLLGSTAVSPQASIAIAYTRIYSVDNEILNNIRNIMGTDAEIQYIKELISVRNVSDQFVQISVYNEDAQIAKQVVDYLYQSLLDRLNGSVGNYSAVVISDYTGYEVDWGMNDDHAASEDNLIKAEHALSEAETNLADMNDEVVKMEQTVSDSKDALAAAQDNLATMRQKLAGNTVTAKNVIKRTARYAIIGFLLGLFGACFLVAVNGGMSSKLQNQNAISSRYGFPVIGVLPRRKAIAFEKTVRKLEGDPDTDFDEAFRSTVQSLLSYANDRRVCMISTGDSAVTEDLAAGLEGKVNVCGNILKDPAAVKALADYDGVVLVEQRGKANLDMIDAEVNRAKLLGKEVIGIVLK